MYREKKRKQKQNASFSLDNELFLYINKQAPGLLMIIHKLTSFGFERLLEFSHSTRDTVYMLFIYDISLNVNCIIIAA